MSQFNINRIIGRKILYTYQTSPDDPMNGKHFYPHVDQTAFSLLYHRNNLVGTIYLNIFIIEFK